MLCDFSSCRVLRKTDCWKKRSLFGRFTTRSGNPAQGGVLESVFGSGGPGTTSAQTGLFGNPPQGGLSGSSRPETNAVQGGLSGSHNSVPNAFQGRSFGLGGSGTTSAPGGPSPNRPQTGLYGSSSFGTSGLGATAAQGGPFGSLSGSSGSGTNTVHGGFSGSYSAVPNAFQREPTGLSDLRTSGSGMASTQGALFGSGGLGSNGPGTNTVQGGSFGLSGLGSNSGEGSRDSQAARPSSLDAKTGSLPTGFPATPSDPQKKTTPDLRTTFIQ